MERKIILIILFISIFFLFSLNLTCFFITQKMFRESKLRSNLNFTEPLIWKIQELPIFLDFFKEKKELISQQKDFLEINLEEMKIKFYKKGLLEREFNIIKRGDPQEWGGSAAGLYKIISGNKLSFSIIANAYMPYALHYYGKYYIHGEPYYSWGEKLEGEVSGGCISLTNEDAKTVYELTELNMPVLVIDKNSDKYPYTKRKSSEFPEISAQSYLVADLDSGYVFSEKDSKKQHPIASLTKLMTAVVVAENVDLRKSIFVEKNMLEAFGSTKSLEVGESFRVIELFYPLLIESSNDAAEVLSYFLGKGKTLKLMNEKTKAISMADTKFTDPTGFDPGNISTARDLFYLARYLLNVRPNLLEITKGKEFKNFGDIKFDIKNLWAKNIFSNDPIFVGGKTGFIKASKYTALFIFRFNTNNESERKIAIILLGSENNETDTQKIYKWLQENYFNPANNIVSSAIIK